MKGSTDFVLERIHRNKSVTIGELTLASLHVCFTQEDAPIPCGRYQIERTYSERFGKTTPLLLGSNDTRIVPRSLSKGTDGCIISGMDKSPDCVNSTQLAYREVLKWIATLESQNIPVWITIK